MIAMKILKIENGLGKYWSVSKKQYLQIDKIDKAELLELLNFFLENEVEMDEIENDNLQNQAHLIIYQSIIGKFTSLQQNKSKFKDESDRLYLDEINKYSLPKPLQDIPETNGYEKLDEDR